MTQDQRYDMITEMYEATRYAKEIHKKAEKEKNKMDAYRSMRNNSSSPKMTELMDDKIDRADKSYKYYHDQDTISFGKDKKLSVSDKLNYGRMHGVKQPGRYKTKKERKLLGILSYLTNNPQEGILVKVGLSNDIAGLVFFFSLILLPKR